MDCSSRWGRRLRDIVQGQYPCRSGAEALLEEGAVWFYSGICESHDCARPHCLGLALISTCSPSSLSVVPSTQTWFCLSAFSVSKHGAWGNSTVAVCDLRRQQASARAAGLPVLCHKGLDSAHAQITASDLPECCLHVAVLCARCLLCQNEWLLCRHRPWNLT